VIKAKPYQQQPPNPGACGFCGEQFNNNLRVVHHKNKCEEKKNKEGPNALQSV